MFDSFNVSRITNRIWVGGGITGEDEIAYLKGQGVTAILSVAAALDDTSIASAAGLDTLHIPWQDDGTAKEVHDFVGALAWLERLDAQRVASGKSLSGLMVHCAQGHNRGPMMATFLLAALSGLPADEAYKLVKGMRPVASSFDTPQYRASVVRALEAVNPVATNPDAIPSAATIAEESPDASQDASQDGADTDVSGLATPIAAKKKA